MRILALTFGSPEQGSTRFRVCQYVPVLREHGLALHPVRADGWAGWSEVAGYDAVLLQKKLLPLTQVRRLRRRTRRLLYDVDDAIWEPHDRPHHWLTRWRTRLRLRAIVRAADVVLAANEVLARCLRLWSERVHVLPMALDPAAWPPRARDPGETTVRLGWAGHPVNLRYLNALEGPLREVLRRCPGTELVVCSGQRPVFRELACRYVPFDPAREAETIRGFDVGLLPLPEGKFAEGKSPIKALQYMASALPTVASPVGAVTELVVPEHTGLFARTPAEWVAALGGLVADEARRLALGKAARRRFEETFALPQVAVRFAEFLRGPPAAARA